MLRLRTRWLALTALALAIAVVLLVTINRVDRKRPNFIIFSADDMGWRDSGAYGHPHIRTPNIDRLAEQGMRFDQAFLTTASCSPSRCSLLTGRYPHATGAARLHDPLPDDQVTFAELLKQAGYYTASAGKWHLGKDAKWRFDKVVRDHESSGCAHWVESLRERPKDRPFLLWLAANDPHRPYEENLIPQPHRPEDVVVPPYLPDDPEIRLDLARYYDEITRMDEYIGQVLAELESEGVASDTFVLFISDNGAPFPRGKPTLYDSGIKAPWLVRFPGRVQPGSVSTSLVSSVDLAPTILELAGLRPSPTMQGRSFARLLRQPTARIRDYVVAEHDWHTHPARERAVRSRDYKYIRNYYPELPATPPADVAASPTYQIMLGLRAGGNLTPAQMNCFVAPRSAEELYSLETDPYELNNLAGDPSHAIALHAMRRALADWQRDTGVSDREGSGSSR